MNIVGLDDDKRLSADYVIDPVTNNPVSNYNTYDTSKEIIIGSWDGTPVYRQVVTWQMPAYWGNANTGKITQTDIPWNCPQLKFVINATAFPAENTLYTLPILGLSNSTPYWTNLRLITKDSIQIQIVQDNFGDSRKWYIVVDYVKQ